MDFSQIGTVMAIVVICYIVGSVFKNIKKFPNKWIPVICGGFGGILGVVGLYTMPEFPAKDIMNAIAVGIVSGLASTGTNQIYKQLTNQKKENES